MTTSESGGAAFNPVVRTEDNVPAPEQDDRADSAHENDEADCGPTTGKDQG